MNTWSRIGVTAAAIAVGVLGVSATSSGAPAQQRPAAPPAARAAAPQLTPEAHFVSVTPCRILDTRNGAALASGASRTVYAGGTTGFAPQGGHSGGCGIPVDATAIAANLVAIKGASAHNGYVKAYPAGTAEPGAAALNYSLNAGTGGTGAQVPIRSAAGPALTLRNAGATIDLVIDVSGYYIPPIQALIGGDGSISAGTSRVVSTSHAGTGFYYVTLDRPARQCAPAAVTYNYGHYASVGLSASTTPNTISVTTWNVNTTGTAVPTDESFFLTVTC